MKNFLWFALGLVCCASLAAAQNPTLSNVLLNTIITTLGSPLQDGGNVIVGNANVNGQAAMSASSPVAIASDQTVADACTFAAKTNIPISTTAGTLQLVAPSGSTLVYVCSIATIGATASIQNLVGGTGATCTTGTPVAVMGSTTAANGMSFATNTGLTYGTGNSVVAKTATAGHGLCLIQSGTAQISGNAMIVQK